MDPSMSIPWVSSALASSPRADIALFFPGPTSATVPLQRLRGLITIGFGEWSQPYVRINAVPVWPSVRIGLVAPNAPDLYRIYGVALRAPVRQVQTSYSEVDAMWIASDTTTTVFGDGSTEDEARDDYIRNLFEHVTWLRNNRELLGGPLLQEYNVLRVEFEGLP